MPSVFDPGVFDDEGGSPDPSNNPEQPEGEKAGGGDQDAERTAEKARKYDELSSKVDTLIAENAALRAQQGQAGKGEPETEFTKEQLKAFALREDGKLQFDGAVAYTDQALKGFEERFKAQMREQQVQERVRTRLNQVLPGITDPASVVSRKAASRQEEILREDPVLASTEVGRARAFEIAVLEIAGESRGGGGGGGGSAREAARDRRIAGSAANPGGGSRFDAGGGGVREVTAKEIARARSYGSQYLTHSDPQKREAAKRLLQELLTEHDQRLPFTGKMAARRAMLGGE